MPARGTETSDVLVRHKSGILRRTGTVGRWDDFVIGESPSYLVVEPTPRDRLLDVGANIGAVSYQFLRRGVRTIVAVEPESDNFEVLCANLKAVQDGLAREGEYPSITTINRAVTPRGEPVTLYLNPYGNKGMHTSRPTRGRPTVEFDGVAFHELLDDFQPTILKMDIEGGEHALANDLRNLPSCVRAVAIEMHYPDEAKLADCWRMHTGFLDQGFRSPDEPYRHPAFPAEDELPEVHSLRRVSLRAYVR